MKKFWKWMVDNMYVEYMSGKLKALDGIPIEGKGTPQMMIGYMIEYCIEEGIDIEDICQYIESIDKLYNYLKQKIEGLA